MQSKAVVTIVAILGITALVYGAVRYSLGDYFEAKALISKYQSVGVSDNWPNFGIINGIDFSVNTNNASNGLPQWCIESLFKDAYRTLKSAHGDSCRLLKYDDQMGYSRMACVVEVGEGEYRRTVIAVASNNNDNNSFWMKYPAGPWVDRKNQQLANINELAEILKR